MTFFAMAKIKASALASFAFRRRKLLACAAAIAAASSGAELWIGMNVSVNISPSLPGHLYLRTGRLVERGSVVNWCPSDPRMIEILRTITPYHTRGSARCPSGEMPLLKIVRAVPGDRVEASGVGRIKVNGLEVPATAPDPFTPLPAWKFDGVIPEGRILLYGLHPGSFDSRYVGMFPLSGVESVMVEIF